MYAIQHLKSQNVFRLHASFNAAARIAKECDRDGKVDDRSPRFGPAPVMATTINSGIQVATLTRPTPLAACTVHYQAGSRYERHHQLGSTHFLRCLSGASGHLSTEYAKIRHLQQLGVQMSCTSDRECISYSISFPPSAFQKAHHYLVDAASRCLYHEWEIDDQRIQVKEDLARITPGQRIMDLVQMAAFRGPLANSVFCLRHQIGEMESSICKGFVGENFVNQQCSVAAAGITHDETLQLSESLCLPDKIVDAAACRIGPPKSVSRTGYECHDLGPHSETWIAVAVPGCGTKDIRNMVALSVIAAACGTRNNADGSHRFCRLTQPPLGRLTQDKHTDYRAFSISYTDIGLFGIVVRAPADKAREVGSQAAGFLKQGLPDLSPTQIGIGKRRLVWDLSTCEESVPAAVSSLAHALSSSECPQQPAEWIELVQQLEVAEVLKAAKSLGESVDNRLVLAVVGDAGAAPSDVELKNLSEKVK